MSLRPLAFSATILALGLCLGTARAEVNASALLALPLGDFSSDDNAMLGYGAGVEYNARLGTGLGSWVSGISCTFNASDKGDAPSGWDVKGGNYLTLPLLTGFRLTGGEDNDKVQFYFQGQIGMVLFMATDMTISAASGSSTTSMSPAASLGFGGGFGFIIRKRIDAGMRILGTPDMSIKEHVAGSGVSGDVTDHITVSMLQFSLGYVF